MWFFIKKTLAILLGIYLLCCPFLPTVMADVIGSDGVFILDKWEFLNNRYFSGRKLNKFARLAKGSLVSQEKINEVVDSIKGKYKSEGFYFIEVDVTKNLDDLGNLDLLYEIKEGQRVKISDIRFSGNTLVPSLKLKNILKTKKNRLFRKGYFEESMIQEDIKSIEKFYSENYYGEARVAEVMKSFSPKGKNVDLTFVIEEALNSVATDYVDALKSENTYAEDTYTEIEKPEVEIEQKSKEQSFTEQRDFEDNDYPKQVKSADNLKRINELEREVKNLSVIIEEKEEVESLLSGLLSTEKITKRKLKEKLLKFEKKVSELEKQLIYEKESKEKTLSELQKKIQEQKEINNRQILTAQKVNNLNEIINVKLKDIELLRDNLTNILIETRTEISKELDRIELSEIAVLSDNKKRNALPKIKTSKAAVKILPENDVDKDILTGRVLVCNESLNFVVINLGASNGVYKGMQFEFARDSKKIGFGKVIEVRKNISAVDLIQSSDDVKIDDLVFERT